MAASAIGCTTIILVDLHDDRLALAKEMGATHGINGGKENASRHIREITGGGADFTWNAPATRRCWHRPSTRCASPGPAG